jgi:phosphoribosyl-ATP pyrophosphohydrolase
MNDVLSNLYSTILKRRDENAEGSYTAYLFNKGLDKILKKCGEECAETIIAAKNGEKSEIINETADLFYHILVLLAEREIDVEEVLFELENRSKKQNNLKNSKIVDKNG